MPGFWPSVLWRITMQLLAWADRSCQSVGFGREKLLRDLGHHGLSEIATASGHDLKDGERCRRATYGRRSVEEEDGVLARCQGFLVDVATA